MWIIRLIVSLFIGIVGFRIILGMLYGSHPPNNVDQTWFIGGLMITGIIFIGWMVGSKDK